MSIRKDLKEAGNLVFLRKDEEALEIYEKYFKENFEDFTKRDRTSYAWAIYRVHITDPKDQFELFDYTEFITEITGQVDLNRRSTCPYTFAVFKVMDKLNDQNDFFNLVYWIEKSIPICLAQKDHLQMEEEYVPARKSILITPQEPISLYRTMKSALRYPKRL